MPAPQMRRSAFTLVELLVVIAIIGILVALLLPAVQAAREAARRTQCMNQMRQMGLAMQNHVDSLKFFPSGGIDTWPQIEDYAAGGKPYTAPKQGLSWAFQILPYLEENSVHNLVSNDQLPKTPINLYFCPSRRPPTQNPGPGAEVTGRWLLDYAALNPALARSEIGSPTMAYVRNFASEAQYESDLQIGFLCDARYMWGGNRHWLNQSDFYASTGRPSFSAPSSQLFPTAGVIVRSNYYVADGTGPTNPIVGRLPLPGPTPMRKLVDGTSKTIVLCEKRIDVKKYTTGGIDDDIGWSDGWDYDTLRLATCQPTSDSGTPMPSGVALTAGSAHPAAFFCAFADGSVRGVRYDVDLETLNRLAHKSDGEVGATLD